MKKLGDFYREKILSQKDLKEIELPSGEGEVKIEKHLFGFILIKGKNAIEVETEEEARYCKVFLEAGLSKVMIPQNQEYLKAILPELEELKAKHDQIINKHLEYIVSKKLRQQILRKVWSRLMWESELSKTKPISPRSIK